MKSYLFLIICSLWFLNVNAQFFADNEYYLIDSLDVSALSKTDLDLVENSLKLYHSVNDDTSRINAINRIVEGSWDNNLWPKYNLWVYNFVVSKLKLSNSKAQSRKLKICLTDALNNIGYLFDVQGKNDKALEYYSKGIEIDKELNNKYGLAVSYNNIGLLYKKQGNISLCLEYYSKSLNLYKEIDNKDGMAISLNNLASIYDDQGDIVKALEFFHESLKMRSKDDKMGIAVSFGNIGSIYRLQDDTAMALEYFHKSLAMGKEAGAKRVMSNALSNISGIYENNGDVKKAIEYLELSLDLCKKEGYKQGLAEALNGIGHIYQRENNDDLALEYFNKSLVLNQELNNKRGIASSLNNIASIALNQNNLTGDNGAEILANKSFTISQAIGYPTNIKSSAHLLSKIYAKQNKGMKALDMYQLYILMRDSIHNDATEKASFKQQAKYEYDKKKMFDDAAHEKQLIIDQKNQQKQLIITYSITGILFLIFIFSIIIFRRLQITKRQKKLIEQQSHDLSEVNEELNQTNEEILAISETIEEQNSKLSSQNNHILSSINYAKRIQEAILPSKEKLSELLPNSSIFYKAKDIVSGDFYWVEKAGDYVFWSAVDCTGHGVPGAFMSIMGYNGLNEIIREKKIIKPSEILEHLTQHVINSLQETSAGETIQDGMDIALCCLNTKTLELQFAGAYNPLYLLKNNATEIEIIKGSRRPIGRFKRKNLPDFINHKIQLEKGDSIYIFTDGVADQFGGTNADKFGYKKIRNIIIDNNNEGCEKQISVLKNELDYWMITGNEEQIDDICFFGVRI